MLELGQRAVKRALELGADDAEVFLAKSRNIDVDIERDDIKMVRSHNREGVGIRVLKDGCIGFSSINSFDPDPVEKKVRDAVRMSRGTIPDPDNVIPSPRPITKVKDLYDGAVSNFNVEDAVEQAGRLLHHTKEMDERFRFNDGFFDASVSHYGVVNSKGIEVEEKSSSFTYMGLGMAVDGDDISNFNIRAGHTPKVDQIDVTGIAEELVESTVSTLGAKKGKTFSGTALFSPYALGQLLAVGLLQPIKANRVQKAISPLGDKLGEKICSLSLTLKDDSRVPGALGSGSFDREGQPTPPLTIIDEGVLKAFLHNSYTAKRAGTESTGHASGGFMTVPGISPSNLIIETGKLSRREIISRIDSGVYIERFSGDVDPVSCEFSGVVKCGHLIEGGEMVRPIRRTMISGNVLDMLNDVSHISKRQYTVPMNLSMFLPYVSVEKISFTSE